MAPPPERRRLTLAERAELSDRFRRVVRVRRLSRRTEEAYGRWIRRFLDHHHEIHPLALGVEAIETFLSALAVERQVSASTQNQAHAALLFFYRSVLEVDFPELEEVVRAKRPRRLPVVLSREEVRDVLGAMSGVTQLMATLLYGAGLRLRECARLRVKDLDFDRHQLVVREAKGGRDRPAILPDRLLRELRRQLDATRAIWEGDLKRGGGFVSVPDGLDRKYPRAPRSWEWQWVFPATRCFRSAEGLLHRHHLHETVLQRAVSEAGRAAGLEKRVTCHTFRHSFATHVLEDGYDIRTVQELLGHRDVATTMVYTHVLNRGPAAVRSPADRLTESPTPRRPRYRRVIPTMEGEQD